MSVENYLVLAIILSGKHDVTNYDDICSADRIQIWIERANHHWKPWLYPRGLLLLDESDSGFKSGAEIICLCRVKFNN